MTNAIEQSKREMYGHLESVKASVTGISTPTMYVKRFEEFLESYLELLRQDLSALHETARKRFEDIQSLEAVNKDLIEQLSKMTEKRDHLRNLQQATEHKNTYGIPERHCKVIAEGLQGDGDAVFRCDPSKPRKCENEGCEAHKIAVAIMAREKEDRASCATLDGKTEAILGAVVDVRQIVSDWAVYGYKAKKQMKKLAYAINNNPELHAAMLQFEKGDGYGTWFLNNTQCMHSFPSGEQCVFCGVGK